MYRIFNNRRAGVIPARSFFFRPVLAGVLVILCLFLLSCRQTADGPVPRWTFLVYLDGDNDLSSAALADLLEMASIGSRDYLNVIVQRDLSNGSTTQRLRVVKNGWELLADLGELDMAAPQTLTDFLVWAKDAYPADRTVLVLWNHGNGWDQGDGPSMPAVGVRHSIFSDVDNGSFFLSNHAVKKAIQASGIGLDLLGLDASIMGTLEACYEFRDLAPVIVGSQEVGQAEGWDYAAVLSALANNPGMTVEDLARVIVKAYRDFLEDRFYPSDPIYEQRHTIAALRTSCLEALAQAVNGLALALTADLNDPATTAATVAEVQAARASVQGIDLYVQPGVYVDLFDFDRLLNRPTQIDSLLSAGTIAEYHGSARPNAHGLSIVFFASTSSPTYDPNYRDYDGALGIGNGGDFINQFSWDEFLAAYYTAAGL